MGENITIEREESQKHKWYLGASYRSKVEKALREASKVDDYRSLTMQFSSNQVMSAFFRIFSYFEKHKHLKIILPSQMETVSGIPIDDVSKVLEIEIDYFQIPLFVDTWEQFARVEICRKVASVGDPLFEESFLKGTKGDDEVENSQNLFGRF